MPGDTSTPQAKATGHSASRADSSPAIAGNHVFATPVSSLTMTLDAVRPHDGQPAASVRMRDRRPTGVTRREWLTACLALAHAPRAAKAQATGRMIDTVSGPIDPSALGVTLMHEHVLVDFIGAAGASPTRYDANAVFTHVLPYLVQARALGCRTLVECTPAYLGRDPRLLRRLAEASGLHILSNTGYYGANQDKHLPPQAFTERAEELAARWIREWERGIDDTGITPAFLKIGVDAGPLSAVDAKLVRAAALTHRATGLPIAAHTGNGVAALEQMDLIESIGAPLSAFIWVHAQAEADTSRHRTAAARGAWVSFDGISEKSVDAHVGLVLEMRRSGHLDHVLVSHDAGWYRVGEPDGGAFRPFDTLFTKFVPALRAAGVPNADVDRLLVDNPRRALAGQP
jgi:phosphotriesterase-related protein